MLSFLVGILALGAAPRSTEASARAQYEAMVKEFDTAFKAYIEAATKAATDQSARRHPSYDLCRTISHPGSLPWLKNSPATRPPSMR